ncbi:hypothetical protein RN001_009301 [Aquatica leii]|uniref:CCDC66 domain-containing protein n=1 Tax=Aquatica leii TaxID=1421715 RepID=A0AAN7SPV4_9COLE|nr:hypothetical protein RN001_009301 [Aquatica leii]
MVYNLPRSPPSPRAKFPSIPLRYTHRKPPKLFSRTRNITKLDTASSNTFIRREGFGSRRQSLPPIANKNDIQASNSNDRYDKELGGETSGYGSDNHTPEYFQHTWNQNLGYESSSSARDDRAKWGDRGVGVGRFWDPHDVKYNAEMNDTPGWVKRGLQGDTELIVSNTSPSESPEQQDFVDQRPYTSSSVSQTRTYIRGQNNPIDPLELAERERKRQLARAHQEAIKQQLEERENKRRLERERRIREEREEELRIEREQELERKRREHENRIFIEKQERERKRKEALEEAIQLAEKEAQEQKRKQKMLKQINLNINENVVEKEKVISPRPIAECTNINKAQNNLVYINDGTIIEEEVQSDDVVKISNKIFNNNTTTSRKETNINRNRAITPIEETQPITVAPQTQAASVVQDNVMVMQNPFEGYQMPFAILMPTFAQVPTTPIPITASVPASTADGPRPRTKNRVLTPTQYRSRQLCDSSTQTDCEPNDKSQEEQKEIKCVREKLSNLEVNDEERSRKDSKSRSTEPTHGNHSSRPKWGANRPPTRYLKQSEKDPFYQRKKSKKNRQIKVYDDKNNNYSPHSSDDSQICSPKSYRSKGYIEKRRTRAMWQKNGQVFARNVRVYQTEIVPLETHKDQIYYKKSECIKCCCDCRSQHHKYTDEFKVVDILKIEHTPREDLQYQNTDDCLPNCPNSTIDNEVLEKLNSLHNGLLMKQEMWPNSPCTPSTPSRTTEIS